MMGQSLVHPVEKSVSEWIHNPKTWITFAVLAFTLGGTVTVYHQTSRLR